MLNLSRNELVLIIQALQLRYWTLINTSVNPKETQAVAVQIHKLREKISEEVKALDQPKESSDETK